MKEMSYRTGEQSTMPNSFDVFPREEHVADTTPDTKNESKTEERQTQVKKSVSKKKEVVAEQNLEPKADLNENNKETQEPTFIDTDNNPAE